jgi:hypothetical protein
MKPAGVLLGIRRTVFQCYVLCTISWHTVEILYNALRMLPTGTDPLLVVHTNTSDAKTISGYEQYRRE